MKRRSFAASLVIAALLGAGLATAPAAQAQGTASAALTAPDALVKSLSEDVLASIRRDPTLQSGDIGRLNALVDEKILPHVNFEKMTRLAVGRGWREATPEQRQALTREFRSLLVRTYAGAVSTAKDYQVRMQPFRAEPADNDVTVRTQAVPGRGEPIQLDYRLERTAAGWKIYDVNVLGIWLVENYRNTFAGEISRGGIDGLIKSLADRNKALEAKAS
ncbi:MAG: ABC transporter substrate-binding protein [Burkholderiales bacterium]|jgi:phospholipid transport system substrate-binding protein|nr:ABC transporter substrate-binding protein [Burkholderiales bacterium]